MAEVDEAEIRRIFDQLSEVTAGRNASEAIAAIQDLYCALICEVSDDLAGAIDLARGLHKDLEETIRNTFDHYHSESGA